MNIKQRISELLEKAQKELLDKEEETKKAQNAEILDNEVSKDAKNAQNEQKIEQTEKRVNLNPNEDPAYKDVVPTSTKELENLLDTVDKDYVFEPDDKEEDLPKELKLERREMPDISKEEIEEDAKKQLDAKYAELERKVNDKANDAAAEKEQQKKTAESLSLSKAEKINMSHDAARVATENDALKRGLARSSVVVFELGNIEESRAKELASVGSELLDKWNSIETELAKIEQEREEAIENLDISRAADLVTETQKKLAELEKTKAEVLKFNNDVEKEETKYNASIEKQRSEAKAKKEAENQAREKEIEQAKKNEQVALIANYYSRYGKNAISELTKNTELADRVGMDVFYAAYKRLL